MEIREGKRPVSIRPWLVATCCLWLAACCANVRPTVKIGLSAPFEGRDRDLGYEVLYGVRLAVRECNDGGGLRGRYLVELVALNDFNEAEEAVAQAYEMDADPDVMAVLGGWSPETLAAAAPAYDELALAFAAPPAAWSGAGFPPAGPVDETFAERYAALSGGVAPGPAAAWAYAEAHRLLAAVELVLLTEGQPARGEVERLLDHN